MADQCELPELDAVNQTKIDLEIRGLEHGRSPDEQFLAEAEAGGRKAFIGQVLPPEAVLGRVILNAASGAVKLASKLHRTRKGNDD